MTLQKLTNSKVEYEKSGALKQIVATLQKYSSFYGESCHFRGQRVGAWE